MNLKCLSSLPTMAVKDTQGKYKAKNTLKESDPKK